MVIDASALVAVIRGEPEAETFARIMSRAAHCRMSPVNWFEVALKAEKEGRADTAALERMAAHLELQIVPTDEIQMRLALRAWRNFGKGRHKAKLNLGDCFAYALAKSLNEPLLFKGDDFPHTDIVAAA
jgi:ribonuclease VapC